MGGSSNARCEHTPSLLAALAMFGLFALLKRVIDIETETKKNKSQLHAYMDEEVHNRYVRRFRSNVNEISAKKDRNNGRVMANPCTGMLVSACLDQVWKYIFKVEAQGNLTEHDFEIVARDTHEGMLELMASIADAEARTDKVDRTQSSRVQDLQAHIDKLDASIADLRDEVVQLRQPSYQPLSAEFDCSGTGTYTLPDSVPQSATVVLVNAFLQSGYVPGQEGLFRTNMWTSQGSRDNTQSVWGHHYPQNAWSYNSGNFEFAVNGNFGRVIHHDTAVFGGSLSNGGCSARLYGYRV